MGRKLATRGFADRFQTPPLSSLKSRQSMAYALLLVTVLLAVACTGSGPPPDRSRPLTTASPTTAAGESATDSSLALRTPTEPPPLVDTSVSSVPIEDIVFDTFRGGFIRLSEADAATIQRLRDSIKPVYEPRYESVEGGEWLGNEDMIIGYVSEGGEAFAYPFKILNFHEIVNDSIDGVPLLVSYCPLCSSAVVYGRELDGQLLLFGNTSALYESDLVMYDHGSGSYWFQVIGEAIVGPRTGDRLSVLPSVTTTWGRWKQLYPSTRVLSRNLGLLRGTAGNPYARDPFVGYAEGLNSGQFYFPVTAEKLDRRLRPGDRVFAVQLGQLHKAFSMTDRSDRVVQDVVGEERILVIMRGEGPSASAYLSEVDGRPLTFVMSECVVEDVETGSRWDDAGRAVSGPNAGARLTPVPSRTSFWFSLVGAVPGIELYSP